MNRNQRAEAQPPGLIIVQKIQTPDVLQADDVLR